MESLFPKCLFKFMFKKVSKIAVSNYAPISLLVIVLNHQEFLFRFLFRFSPYCHSSLHFFFFFCPIPLKKLIICLSSKLLSKNIFLNKQGLLSRTLHIIIIIIERNLFLMLRPHVFALRPSIIDLVFILPIPAEKVAVISAIKRPQWN